MITSSLLKKSQSLIALLILMLVLSLVTDKFLTAGNLWNVLRQISVNMCLSIGMTLVILTAGIDLSVGAILGLSGAICAGLLKSGIEIPAFDLWIGFTVLGAIVAAIAVGTALGLFNGWVITRFSVPPFVATLSMLTVARGLTFLYTQGQPISDLGTNFEKIGAAWFLGVPVPVWISALFIAIFYVLTTKTSLGRFIYAIGGNEKAAIISGVPIQKVKWIVYALSGAMAAVGGVLVTSRLNSAQPNAGINYELDAIAAIVIGGTSLSGGQGSVKGTIIGAILIGILNNGLVLLNVSPFWQQVVKGLVILLAVIVDKMNQKAK
jgi:ribose transport system permease protein